MGKVPTARGREKEDRTTESGIKLEPVPGLPGALPPLPAAEEASAYYFNLLPSGLLAVVNIAPPPRFGATHVPPNGTTSSFHEGSRTNPLSFSGP